MKLSISVKAIGFYSLYIMLLSNTDTLLYYLILANK